MQKGEAKKYAKSFIELSKQDVIRRKQSPLTPITSKSLISSPVITSPLLMSSPLISDIEFDSINNKWYKKHNYQEIKRLGSGQFGVTSLVKNINTGDNVVLKAVKINEKNVKDIYNEIFILKKIAKYGCKDNLLCYIEHYIDQEHNIMYIVTDVFENSTTLTEFIRKNQIENKTIDTNTLLKIMKGLLKAIVYLHKIGIAHADIKPENILINDKFEVQLIDFGISCTKSCTVLGTLLYQSPELLRLIGGKKQNLNILKRADIFSLGMVFYLLANLTFPFPIEGDYILNKKSDYTKDFPIVKLNAASLLFSLNTFYVKIGGFLTSQDRKKYKESGREEPKNQIKSYYSNKYDIVDQQINKLIIRMLNPNFEKRPLAKNCMSKLNKIIKTYNEIITNIQVQA